jgi:hypothetical protein
MIFMKNNKKKILIVVLFVMAVLVTSRTHATPLYGGYNGESETWFEYRIAGVNTLLFSVKVFLGVDSNDHRWAKFRVSIIPFIVWLDVTYDSADIVSLNFSTLLPWPIQIGTEIDIYGEGRSLWWFVVNVVSGIAGVDSEGTTWTENGLPGVWGSGSDRKSNGESNGWVWLKILDWLFGVRVDLPIDGELFLKENNAKDFGEELLSVQDDCSQAYADQINVLLEKFTDGNVMKDMVHLSEKFHRQAVQLPFAQNNQGLPVVAPLGELQPELDALSDTIKKEVFTEEVRGELQKLLNSFARDSQPPLRKIRETMTAP